MSRRISLDEAKRRLHEVWGDAVTLDETTYVKADVKARFIDKEYGPWWTLLKCVVRGQRHTTRKSLGGKSQRLGIEKLEKRLREVHGDVVTLVPTRENEHQKEQFD